MKNFDELGLSIGVSTAKDFSSLSNEDLIKQADEALYKAKKNGKNKYIYCIEMMQPNLSQMTFSNGIRPLYEDIK